MARKKKKIDPIRSARNWLTGVGCFASVPTLMVGLISVLPDAAPVIWDGVTFGLLGISLVAALLAFLAAVLINKRSAAGRAIGYIPACMVCIFFPIGTITGVMTITALNRPGLRQRLG